MTVLAALGYLRVIVAGLLSCAWRTIYGRECPCEFCRAHRKFVREGGGWPS